MVWNMEIQRVSIRPGQGAVYLAGMFLVLLAIQLTLNLSNEARLVITRI